MQLTLQPVTTQAQIATVAEIARTVWHATYDPLLPPGQVDYMLEKYQSPAAIRAQQAQEHYEYVLVLFDGIPGGFVGFAPRYAGREEMFLSKLYFLPAFRGQGGVRAALGHVLRRAREEGLGRVRLTVNKHNDHAVAVYRHLGFTVSEQVCTDIGGGYVMDDFIMTLPVEPA